MSSSAGSLKGAEAYIFDVFGTVIDWYGNVMKVLAAAAPPGATDGMGKESQHTQPSHLDTDWGEFANEWRSAYFDHA